MQTPKLSTKALLAVNLALGAFVAMANGLALAITVSGGRSHLSNQVGEIVLWIAAGVALVSLSLLGIRRTESSNRVVELQLIVLLTLVGGLAIWALSISLGLYRVDGPLSWSAGFLSVLGLYCYVVYMNVTSIRGWGALMKPFALVFVAACVAIDVMTFVALAN